jgi:hypothetical protein
MVFKGLDDVGDCRPFCTDGNINAVELFLGVSRLEVGLLIDDGIDGNGSLSSLPVADDEFSLTSSNGDKAVNGLQTSLHGLVN